MKKITREEVALAVKGACEEWHIEFPLVQYVDIERVFDEIKSHNSAIPITISLVVSHFRVDSRIQVEYESEKLGKPVVWDEYFEETFKTVEELIQCVYSMLNGIYSFEDSLPAYSDDVSF